MTVHLVGAGPGDPELLTMKAVRLLSQADAVVYDRLIGDGVLDHVPTCAERHPVGKEPGGRGATQDEINTVLVELGRRLATVVRVKGGDPFLFGRGIEEAAALERAGIEVELVPGVTSALAGPMAAGISPTGRRLSSGVCVITGHQDPASADIDWDAVAASGLTVVVLMGARRARAIASRLIEGGLSPETPAAVVHNATTHDQAEWFGPLRDLGQRPVPAPSVLVVGPAAGPRHRVGGPRSAPELRHVLDTAGVAI